MTVPESLPINPMCPRDATDPTIASLRNNVRAGDYRFTIHGFERCVERSISPSEVTDAILSGEIIENYPEDKYGPSCLICGTSKGGRIIHVQCSIGPVWIITTYDPTSEPEEWDKSFRRRRTK